MSGFNKIEKAGARLIHRVYPDFYQRLKEEKLLVTKNTSLIPDKTNDAIALFHRNLGKTFKNTKDKEQRLLKRKQYYFAKHVIKKEDIPDSYFKAQQRLAREQGRGNIEINDDLRNPLSENIISDQKHSLENWIDYFYSEDAKYPNWAKHWAFEGMLKLGRYDKERQKFTTRDKETVAPFAELNREALAIAIDLVSKKVEIDAVPNLSKEKRISLLSEKIPEINNTEQLKDIVLNANFKQLYEYALKQASTGDKALENTEGKWIKYPQGSDHNKLVSALKGHGTGWCTVAESTAEIQLKKGDFYVFFSEDKNGNATIPRAAIRMVKNTIAEVRGIAEEQHLDPFIVNVVEEKLSEFPDSASYKKKVNDMKILTEIDKKVNNNQDLNLQELRFLYEIDNLIEGFGYQKDPRIEEIKAKRNIKADYAKIFDVHENQVASSLSELKENPVVFAGDLNLRDSQLTALPDSLTHIGGDLELYNSKITKLPDSLSYIGGGLNLYRSQLTALPHSLTHIEGDLCLAYSKITALSDSLTHIGGGIILECSKITALPDSLSHIGGGLNLGDSKITALPHSLSHIGGNLDLSGSEITALPDSLSHVGGRLNLRNTKITALPDSLSHIGGDLDLRDSQLTALPDSLTHIGGGLIFSNSSKSIALPDSLRVLGEIIR